MRDPFSKMRISNHATGVTELRKGHFDISARVRQSTLAERIRPARNAFGQNRDNTSMFISGPQLLFHLSVLCMAGGYSAAQI